MKTELIAILTQSFQEMAHKEEEVEFWYARDLQQLLGYSRWENFVHVIEKAKIACTNANKTHVHHFRDTKKLVTMGSTAQRAIDDIRVEDDITAEHVKNNSDVRSLLSKSGIVPENLPAEEDISKLKRRMATEGKHLLKGAKKFAKKNNAQNKS